LCSSAWLLWEPISWYYWYCLIWYVVFTLGKIVRKIQNFPMIFSSAVRAIPLNSVEGEGSFCFWKNRNPHSENIYFSTLKNIDFHRGRNPTLYNTETPLPTFWWLSPYVNKKLYIIIFEPKYMSIFTWYV